MEYPGLKAAHLKNEQMNYSSQIKNLENYSKHITHKVNKLFEEIIEMPKSNPPSNLPPGNRLPSGPRQNINLPPGVQSQQIPLPNQNSPPSFQIRDYGTYNPNKPYG